MEKNLSQTVPSVFRPKYRRALLRTGLVATCSLATIFLIGCKEHTIQSTRFGVIDCGPINANASLCVVKDEISKKKYLVCWNCQVSEYKEKK